MGIFDQTGGGKSFSFNQPGDGLEGTVESFKVSQATKFDSVNWKPTNDPDFWPSGDPKMQVQINIQTTLNSGEEGDAGVRSIYATITSAEGTMFRAIQDAIKAAHGGVKADIEEGAFIQVWYSHDDPNSKNQRNPKKCYGANYRRPAGTFGQEAPAVGQATQGQLNVQQPAPQGFQPQQSAPAPQQVPQAAQQPQWGQPQQAAPGVDFGQFEDAVPAASRTGQPAQFNPIAASQGQDPWTGGPAQPQQGMMGQQGQAQPGFYGGQPQTQQAPAQQSPAPQQGFAQAAPQQQAPQPAAAPQVVDVDMQRVQALIGAQLDDATIIGATGITPEALNLARNLGQPAPGTMPS